MRRSHVVLACGLASLAVACAAAVESSKIEDRARRTIPIPICLKPLPRHAGAGVVATLSPPDYWSLLFPTYDSGDGTLDTAASNCAGNALLTAPELSDAEGARTTLNVTPTNMEVAKGPDGFQVIWLRSHRFADGTAAGALALVRPREAYAEAYAIGLFRGSPEGSKFGYQRLGADILVTAANEACASASAGQDCESSMTLYLARDGTLKQAARFAIDRVRKGTMSSVQDPVLYRMTAVPKYKDRSVLLSETLVVRDSGQNEIRRATLDRTWTLAPDGKLVADVDSLWARVATPSVAPSAPTAPPPSSNPKLRK